MNIEDIPADLFAIINHALIIISWQENLQADEIPPHWMWHLDWELEDWWKKVERLRNAKYGITDDTMNEVDENGNFTYEENSLFAEFEESLKG